MSISPSQITDLSPEEVIIKDKVEIEIDAQLRLGFDVDKTVEVRNALIWQVFDQNPRVLNAIIDIYTEKGWRVVRYENKDQGPWLSFSVDPT